MQPVSRSLTLDRNGIVKVRVHGDNHCGAKSSVTDGTVLVKYQVHIVVEPGDVDDRGFLVDQEALHNYLTDLGSSPVPWHESCEALTLTWGRKLITWVTTQNIYCEIKELKLTLSPMPHLGAFTATFTV